MIDQPKENLMRHTDSPRRDKRAWILLLGGLTVMGLQVPLSSSQAQETAERPELNQSNSYGPATGVAQIDGSVTPLTIPNQLTRPSNPSFGPNSVERFSGVGPEYTTPTPGYRPISETRYVAETYEVGVPTGSPTDNNFRSEKRTRIVPILTQRWVPVGDPAANDRSDSQIMRLVEEMKRMKHSGSDSTQIESKTSELQKLLNAEFTRMHEQQAAEIETTENRLAALKKLHEQRGEKQAEIVQRRVDQLLGKTNPLDWNVSPTPPENTGVTGVFQIYSPEFETRATATRTPARDRADVTADSSTSPESQTLASPYAIYGTRELKEEKPRLRSQNIPTESSPNSAGRDQPEFDHRNQTDMFAVISKASEAHLAVQSAKLNLENVQRLFDQKIITSSELRKATFEHTAAQKAVEILTLQLESMERMLLLELQAARVHVASESELLKTMKDVTEQASAKRELRKAQSTVDAAKENLMQLKDALRLVPFIEKPDEATSDVVAPTAEQQPAAKADVTPPVENSAPAALSND